MRTIMRPATRTPRTLARYRLWTLALAFVALEGSGCGTWLGNPKNPDPGGEKPAGNSMVTLKITGKLPTAAALTTANVVPVVGADGAAQGSLVLSKALLVLDEIELKLTDDDAEEKQKFGGPFVVDLLADRVSPDPGEIEVPAGTYRGIKLKLAKLEDEDADGLVPSGSQLVDNSIYLTGTYTPESGDATPFSMTFDLDEEFKLRASSTFAGMNVVEGAKNAIVIAFRVERWFDLTGGEADFAGLASGPIVLEKDSDDDAAKALREAIKENIKASAEFGKDEDDDGKLGGHESSDDDEEEEEEEEED
jgi:hypothetical protein